MGTNGELTGSRAQPRRIRVLPAPSRWEFGNVFPLFSAGMGGRMRRLLRETPPGIKNEKFPRIPSSAVWDPGAFRFFSIPEIPALVQADPKSAPERRNPPKTNKQTNKRAQAELKRGNNNSASPPSPFFPVFSPSMEAPPALCSPSRCPAPFPQFPLFS